MGLEQTLDENEPNFGIFSPERELNAEETMYFRNVVVSRFENSQEPDGYVSSYLQLRRFLNRYQDNYGLDAAEELLPRFPRYAGIITKSERKKICRLETLEEHIYQPTKFVFSLAGAVGGYLLMKGAVNEYNSVFVEDAFLVMSTLLGYSLGSQLGKKISRKLQQGFGLRRDQIIEDVDLRFCQKVERYFRTPPWREDLN